LSCASCTIVSRHRTEGDPGTVSRGVDELRSGQALSGRVRRPGGGRQRAADLDPGLRPALLALVEPDERGDPMSPLRWTTKSIRKLAAALTRQGHRVSADTVAGPLGVISGRRTWSGATISGPPRHGACTAGVYSIRLQILTSGGVNDCPARSSTTSHAPRSSAVLSPTVRTPSSTPRPPLSFCSAAGLTGRRQLHPYCFSERLIFGCLFHLA
jgi:hypothetical protein